MGTKSRDLDFYNENAKFKHVELNSHRADQ